jgi:cardiolipin synthase
VREGKNFVPREKAGAGRPATPGRGPNRAPLAGMGENRTLAYAIVRFSVLCHAALIGLIGALYLPGAAARWIEVAGYSTAALALLLVLFLSNIGLFRRAPLSAAAATAPAEVTALGLANKLTLVRFVMVAPMLFVIADSHLAAGIVLYAASGLTDVADGYVARRRGEETRFGVMMDPVADILTTAGVFGVLFLRGLVPWWVAAVLLVRYASLGLGSLLLTVFVGPIVYKATVTGKIVGVLQAAAVILILALTAAKAQWQESLGPYLFPFLASIFAWVIVSKLIIAARHIRKGRSDAGAQGRPERFSADTGDADALPRERDG